MANADHLRKLGEGPKAWNAWRDAHPDIIPDLAGAKFALGQRQFGSSNGGPVNLHAANLEGAMLRHATLTDANLEAARLNGADLVHARLNGAKLRGADLSGAFLDHADLKGADCHAAVIVGASLADASNLTQAQIEGARGDFNTVLPAGLTPPEDWFGAQDDEFWAHLPENAGPYAILKLPRSAELDEVRAAYRKLAKRYHPDLNPGDDEAERRFKRVTNAYASIMHPDAASTAQHRRPFYQHRAVAGGLFLALLIAPSALIYWFTRAPMEAPQNRPAPVQMANPESSAVVAPAKEELVTGAITPPDGPPQAAEDAPVIAEVNPSPAPLSRPEEVDKPEPASEPGRTPSPSPIEDPATPAQPASESAALVPPDSKPVEQSQPPDAKPVEQTPPPEAEPAAPAQAEETISAAAPVVEPAPAEPLPPEAIPLPLRSAAADARRPADLESQKRQTPVPPDLRGGDKSAWNAALKLGTNAAFESYLRTYPKGRYAALARAKLTALKDGQTGQSNAEASAWAKAQQEGTPSSYAAFLSAHPAGRYADAARRKAAEPESTQAQATPPPLQSRIPQSQQSRRMRWPSSDEPFVEPMPGGR